MEQLQQQNRELQASKTRFHTMFKLVINAILLTDPNNIMSTDGQR